MVATMIKRSTLVLAAAAAAAIVAAPAGHAALACNGSSYPFAQFGDNNSYFAFANNGFENGSTGWKLSNASVGPGNEPWFVNGGGSSSLSTFLGLVTGRVAAVKMSKRSRCAAVRIFRRRTLERLTMSKLYDESHRKLQRQFDTERLADRIEQRLFRDHVTDDDRAFIERMDMFFLATANAEVGQTARIRGATRASYG